MRPSSAYSDQLAALDQVAREFARCRIEYWLFGGWAVDFHAGRVTRPHDDVDVAVWRTDMSEIQKLLEGLGWRHAPSSEDDGGTGFEQGRLRLETTFLELDEDGRAYTQLRDGRATWSNAALGKEVKNLRGVNVRVIGFEAVKHGKSSSRDEPDDAVNDRMDFAVLCEVKR